MIDIIKEIENATGIEPQPFSSKSIQSLPSISYILYKQGDNAVVQAWRLQIRITAKKFSDTIHYEDLIAKALLTLGDEEKLGALKIVINGGGTIEDPTTGLPQLMVYYDITERSN